MAGMILFAVLTAVVLRLLLMVLVKLHDYLSRRLPPTEPDSYFYDEDGNYIYYDRRLIARLEKERQKAADNKE